MWQYPVNMPVRPTSLRGGPVSGSVLLTGLLDLLVLSGICRV
jgi:hypothetical protein